MTLLDIVSQACALFGRNDAATLDYARNSCRRWHTSIWNQATWRETNMLVYTVAGGTQFICPPQMERVTAVRRSSDLALPPVEIGNVFQLDPGIFERAQGALSFSIMPSVASRVELAGQPVRITLTSSADIGQTITIQGQRNGEEVFEAVTMGGLSQVTTNSFDQFLASVSKSVTTGAAVLTNAGNSAALVTLQPYQTTVRYCRILFLEQLPENETILVLGKRQCPPIMTDSDSPHLSNIDEALIAYVRADLLRRDRQFSQAAAMVQEAAAHVQTRADLERAQTASAPRLIPLAEPSSIEWGWDFWTRD